MSRAIQYRCPACNKRMPEPRTAYQSPVDGSVRSHEKDRPRNVLVFSCPAPCPGTMVITNVQGLATYAFLSEMTALLEQGEPVPHDFLFKPPDSAAAEAARTGLLP